MLCEQSETLLALLALDELDSAQRAELQAHLDGCPACREKLGDLRVTLQLLNQAVARETPRLSAERRAALDRLAAEPAELVAQASRLHTDNCRRDACATSYVTRLVRFFKVPRPTRPGTTSHGPVARATPRPRFDMLNIAAGLLVAVALGALFLPALAGARERSRRTACMSNLGQTAKGLYAYTQNNDDFFPFSWSTRAREESRRANCKETSGQVGKQIYAYTQANDAYFPLAQSSPQPDLSVLYPAYVDDVRVYGAPSTEDQPLASLYPEYLATAKPFRAPSTEEEPALRLRIETEANVPDRGTIVLGGTDGKYQYQGRSHFRDEGSGAAMATDGDGHAWLSADGRTPTDSEAFHNRRPRNSGHDSGQNVMYFDGKTKWADNNYASDDPMDNIYCPNGGQVSSHHIFGDMDGSYNFNKDIATGAAGRDKLVTPTAPRGGYTPSGKTGTGEEMKPKAIITRQRLPKAEWTFDLIPQSPEATAQQKESVNLEKAFVDMGGTSLTVHSQPNGSRHSRTPPSSMSALLEEELRRPAIELPSASATGGGIETPQESAARKGRAAGAVEDYLRKRSEEGKGLGGMRKDADMVTDLPTVLPAQPPSVHAQAARQLARSNWKANREGGQNVLLLYVDGHVSWESSNLWSADTDSFLVGPSRSWGADTDAMLWEGSVNRTATAPVPVTPAPTPAPEPPASDTLPAASSFQAGPVNPWVMATQDRMSTFALDVDTASYSIGRNFIRRGFLPPAASVRMEEYVNAFDYNYPTRGGQVFTVHAEAAPSPFRPAQTLVKIGVRGRVMGRDGRKPASVVFVVDASGSMERPDRLPLVQHALKTLAAQLDPGDSVSLVAYGTRAALVLESTPASERQRIEGAIDAIQCGGSTNMLEGLRVGYEMARRAFRAGATNRVILCSDGIANVGATEADEMLKDVEEFRKQGIAFTAVGFGSGEYNDALMERLADRGDGSYIFVDTAAEAQRVFVDEVAATLHTVARDAKIQVEFDPARVRRFRLIGFENRVMAHQDFRNDSVDAGEVGSNQSSTALYELELLPGAERADLGVVSVRYRNAETGQVEEIAHRLSSAIVQPRTPQDAPRFFLAACAAQFAEILRQSEHAQQGKLADVRGIMEQVAAQLPLDQRVQELLSLVQRAEGLPRAQ